MSVLIAVIEENLARLAKRERYGQLDQVGALRLTALRMMLAAAMRDEGYRSSVVIDASTETNEVTN